MRLKLIPLLICLFSFFSVKAQIQEPVKWSQSITSLGNAEYELVMTATIDDGWYIYDMGPYKGGPNATTVVIPKKEGVTFVGEVIQGTPKKKYDESFEMDIKYFEKKAVFKQKIKLDNNVDTEVNSVIEWQSCNDMNCLPPTEHEFVFKIKATADATTNTVAVDTAKKDSIKVIAETVTPQEKIIPEQVEIKEDGETTNGGSFWGVIIEAILWGFAALLTPCVFPMVPMTVSFFMKGSDNKTKGRSLATLYGISIIALYTIPIAAIILITYVLGGDAVTADIFNWLSTHWLPNVIFFLIFMLFAASFFGAFEIVLPSKLVNKSDTKADKGGIVGTFFMALTLVLVSFSCTGPIVGSILVKSTQGEIWEPIITMFAFSTAFAIPFTLFAFFPSLLKNLPKSGGWLNSVKVVLGFIELALGLKFLSVADQTYHWGILDREVYLALWIVIFSLLGFYLLGKLKFAHDSDEPYIKVKRLFLSVITFAFVIYLIPGMFGAPLKALSGYLPPMHSLDFNLSLSGGKSTTDNTVKMKVKHDDKLHLPLGIQGFFDYKEGMEYAKKVGKPVLLDFSGHGCVNCREMENNVWSNDVVLSMLKNDYVVIALYVDDKLELPESEWVVNEKGKTLKTIGKINADFQITKFGVNGQPYYVLLNNEGELLAAPRGYNLNINEYIDFLKKGLDNYKK